MNIVETNLCAFGLCRSEHALCNLVSLLLHLFHSVYFASVLLVLAFDVCMDGVDCGVCVFLVLHLTQQQFGPWV